MTIPHAPLTPEDLPLLEAEHEAYIRTGKGAGPMVLPEAFRAVLEARSKAEPDHGFASEDRAEINLHSCPAATQSLLEDEQIDIGAWLLEECLDAILAQAQTAFPGDWRLGPVTLTRDPYSAKPYVLMYLSATAFRILNEADHPSPDSGKGGAIDPVIEAAMHRSIISLNTTRLIDAAKALADACCDADAREELDMSIDGSLMDAVNAAISEIRASDKAVEALATPPASEAAERGGYGEFTPITVRSYPMPAERGEGEVSEERDAQYHENRRKFWEATQPGDDRAGNGEEG